MEIRGQLSEVISTHLLGGHELGWQPLADSPASSAASLCITLGLQKQANIIQPFVWGLGLRVKSSSLCIRCSGLRVIVASLLLNMEDKEDCLSQLPD